VTDEYAGPERRETRPGAPADVTYSGPERRRGYPPASRTEVTEMRIAQEALDRSVRGLHSQLRNLDATLRDFVPRREVEEGFATKDEFFDAEEEQMDRRRVVGARLAGGIVLAVQIHDLHVEKCRPVEPGGTIGAVESTGVRFACDAAFPFSYHGSGEIGAANVLGFFLYAVFFAWVAVEMFTSRRRQKGRRR
jgi:hypothetical protein